MNIKNILMIILTTFILCSPAMAIDFVCEPEDNNAVSYSVFSHPNANLETTFVKYAVKSGDDSYWIRISEITKSDKILNYITLIIDNKKYNIVSVVPNDKYVNAGITVQKTYSNGFIDASPTMRTNIRYFPLSPEVVYKLKNAKNVILIYNTYKVINQSAVLYDKFLNQIKEAYSLEYNQYGEYWMPKDDSK